MWSFIALNYDHRWDVQSGQTTGSLIFACDCKESGNCLNEWWISQLGLNNDSLFPPGTLKIFLQATTTNTLTPSTSSVTNLLRRTQTNSPSHKPPTERRFAAEYLPLISGVWLLQMDPLCHLPGAVQRHSHPHCGHRHGDGINEAALWLHPDLTWDLPLQTGRSDRRN